MTTNSFLGGGVGLLRSPLRRRSGPTVFTPATPPGLAGWYRFNEGSGTVLTDSSGKGRHGTIVGSPAWGSPGGLTFTGTQRVTLPDAAFASAKTIVFVAAQPGAGYHVAVSGNAGDLNLLCADGNPAFLRTNVANVSASAALFRGVQMLTGVAGASADRLYLSDKELSYYVRGASAALSRTSPAVGNGLGSALPWGAAVYYAVFYDVELRDEHVACLRRYIQAELAAAWGLKPQVVFDGNSLTSGEANVVAADRYFNQASLLLTGAPTTVKAGISGQQMSAIVATGPRAEYDVRRPKNVYAIWEITNHLSLGSASVVAAYQAVIDACVQQRDRGFKVVVGTCLPRNDQGNFSEYNRQAVNALVRANWRSFADGLSDFGADPTIGAFGANQSATYYVDTIHLTGAGNAIAASIAAAAINPLL